MMLGKEDIKKLIKEFDPPLISDWIDLDVQLQPAGFDLTLREVRTFKGSGCIDFNNTKRILPNTELIPFDANGFVNLNKGAYLIVFNEIINLPLEVAAIAKPRSSLLRCGATVETAVWDPGYRGRSKALLIVYNDDGIRLEKNARIVQLIFIKLSSSSTGYRGMYQGET